MMELLDRKDYFKALSSDIQAFMHKKHPYYLWWFLLYLPALSACVYFLQKTGVLWFEKIPLSMMAGACLGGLMMLGHELSHKSVIQSPTWTWLLTTFCIMQHGMTATVWDHWHNRLHHVNTQVPFEDPDSWGYEKLYEYSAYFRNIFKFSPGSGTLLSGFFLFFYFSWQSFMATFLHPKVLITTKQKFWNRLFFLTLYTSWIAGSYALGGVSGIGFLFLIPLAISNFVMMIYISTNHFISRINPMDGPNDTLLNTLSVKVPRWMNFLHFNISYHIEHHIFPYMSSHHYPKVQRLLRERYPEKYQCMPILKALKTIYNTPRFYRDTQTLIHPETKRMAHTVQ